VEFRILGPLEAFEDGAPVALGGRKQRALLTVLLLSANEVISTERLIDALWEEPPANATKAVQVYVSRLRKALGGSMPASRAPGYVLELVPEQLDVTRFRQLRSRARRDPTGAAEVLRDALALWRGTALEEFEDAPFARSERLRLEEERMEVVEERIEADLALGRHATLVSELEALVTTHPLRERLRGQLMVALYRCGRQADALAAYREGRRKLVDELGLEPGRALQQLEQAILRQDPALELAVSSAAPATADAGRPAPRSGPRAPSSPPAGVREERKVVSVLFVDPVASTSRAELPDPEDLGAALRRFHTAAKVDIERFGGTIESLLGGTAMAVFGAPVAHEDDPERAVRAALAIRQRIRANVGELRARMGIDTGLGLVSLGARPDGGPITTGDVIKTAQRLQIAATLNGILVGEQTRRATREIVDYRHVPSADPAAETGAINAWEVITALPQRGVDLMREPRTPLIGRKRELELLASALARVLEARAPQLVTVVGVPGIGKSRLVLELSKSVAQRREQVTWRQGRCLSYGDGVSFWALGEIIKAQAGILESDSIERAADRLRSAIDEVLPDEDEAVWVERELRPLVGARADVRPAEPSEARFTAWRRFLEATAEMRPLALVFEDLHWADDGLLDFIDELTDRARDAPLLVVCTARPELFERRPGWAGGKANAATISLTSLSDSETARLVAAVLEPRSLDAVGHETLLARAAGNPLYAEQFARVLAEVGAREELPETVHGIIAARVDALPLLEKEVLQDAAVFGKTFWLGAVEAIGERSGTHVPELLLALERKEFVQQARRSAVAGQAEYVFRHILLRDVAYAQIPRSARSDKHQRAAAWIESLGRAADHAEMLAHHYLGALEYAGEATQANAALVERARLALRAAGRRALTLASYSTAARFYDDALELWPNSDPERARLLVEAGRARHAADGTGIDLLEQAFDALRARGELDGAAEVAIEAARRFWLGGDRDTAYRYLDRAIELTQGDDGSRSRVAALVERAAYHMNASEFPDAIRLTREALPLTEASQMTDWHIRALDVLGSSRSYSGDLAGLDDSRRAVELARERKAFSRLIVAQLNLHSQHYFLGQLDAASEALRGAHRDVVSYGTADQRNWLRVAEAHEAVLHGRWDAAFRLLDERIAQAETGLGHYLDSACHTLRASIALARGNLEAASADSAKALSRARNTKDPQVLGDALALRAIVLLALGSRDRAMQLASEVLARGHTLVAALLELQSAATPIELAWLMLDLGRETDLVAALESAPATPWLDAARATAHGDLAHSVELVAQLNAPSVEAYAQLRVAGQMARLGRPTEAENYLETALAFFRHVGARRYIDMAEELRRRHA
jgi:DNA-binding SARP family transcriptional activator/tetratricopeptide (TPR) repeat protein